MTHTNLIDQNGIEYNVITNQGVIAFYSEEAALFLKKAFNWNYFRTKNGNRYY